MGERAAGGFTVYWRAKDGAGTRIWRGGLTHSPGHGAEFDMPLAIVAVPEVLIRHLTIEDVGAQFGVPSSRRSAESHG